MLAKGTTRNIFYSITFNTIVPFDVKTEQSTIDVRVAACTDSPVGRAVSGAHDSPLRDATHGPHPSSDAGLSLVAFRKPAINFEGIRHAISSVQSQVVDSIGLRFEGFLFLLLLLELEEGVR